jgi:hypothetical protein
VVEAFNDEGCPAASTVADPSQLSRVGPLGLAVIGFCQSDAEVGENLLRQAESGDPENDLIYYLHARFRYKRNPKEAEALWQKVMLYARTESMKATAKRYLDGQGSGDEPLRIENRWRYYVNVMPGAGAESNPFLQPISEPYLVSTGLFSIQAAAGATRSLGAASFGLNFATSYTSYVATADANLWQNTLELPLSVRAGTNEDIRIRPFGGYQTLRDYPFYLYGGLSVVGDTWRGSSRHAVQGTVYFDHFYLSDLAPEAGTHFRFDYIWEEYPHSWFLQFITYLEHVQAGRDYIPSQGINVRYSHNDIAVQGFAEYNLRWVILSASLKLLVRVDDNSSTYPVNGNPTRKQREDFQVTLVPSLAFPLGPGVHLIASYKVLRQYSTFGAYDFSDNNIEDHVAQLQLRASFTSF